MAPTRTMLEAAEHYIAANKSDPFCRDRVTLHLNNGIASICTTDRGAVVEGYYSATPYQEKCVTAPGSESFATVYRNMFRP